MNMQSLYIRNTPLAEPLTVGLLRQNIKPDTPIWISLEPRAWLPERNGRRISGRLPGLSPLARALPDSLDDLPLLAASLFGAVHWQHFYDAHPFSGLPGQVITWSMNPAEGSQAIEGLLCQKRQVLPWQDRQRFGLPPEDTLPASLSVEHYYQSGKRLAWRLIPTGTEANV